MDEKLLTMIELNLFALLAGGVWLWICKRKRRGATVNWIQFLRNIDKRPRQDVREIWRGR
jgi:hypothetical protein